MVTESVRYYHERFDGKGYPYGIKGENIPLGARIIGVADAYYAMTSERSYRKKRTGIVAIDELEKCSGTQFDPAIVKAFLKVLKKN